MLWWTVASTRAKVVLKVARNLGPTSHRRHYSVDMARASLHARQGNKRSSLYYGGRAAGHKYSAGDVGPEPYNPTAKELGDNPGRSRRPPNMQSPQQLVAGIRAIERSKRRMVEDPMTSAMGAPVGDFFEMWNRKARNLAGLVMQKARKGSKEYKFAADYIERFMPNPGRASFDERVKNLSSWSKDALKARVKQLYRVVDVREADKATLMGMILEAEGYYRRGTNTGAQIAARRAEEHRHPDSYGRYGRNWNAHEHRTKREGLDPTIRFHEAAALKAPKDSFPRRLHEDIVAGLYGQQTAHEEAMGPATHVNPGATRNLRFPYSLLKSMEQQADNTGLENDYRVWKSFSERQQAGHRNMAAAETYNSQAARLLNVRLDQRGGWQKLIAPDIGEILNQARYELHAAGVKVNPRRHRARKFAWKCPVCGVKKARAVDDYEVQAGRCWQCDLKTRRNPGRAFTHESAKKAAKANAKYFGVPFAVFADTSGNWRAERLTKAPKNVPGGLEVFKPSQYLPGPKANPGYPERFDKAVKMVANLVLQGEEAPVALRKAARIYGVDPVELETEFIEKYNVLARKLDKSPIVVPRPKANPGADMGSIVKTTDFKKGLKLYNQIHGCDPKSIKRTILRMGPNDNKVTGRVVLVGLGKAPAESYEPPKGSRKEGHIYVHPYDNKPDKVVTIDGKTIITMPGSHGVRVGTDGEAWIHG
jgi:hypothetical protein